ncbi:Holliday junction branch migration protein RuvA [Xylanimonas oleitrophica]|uniref:Holliday junction branch migration complex subunit RuvA n=1 Tax=Xylanimonas oleitrophica TaxID=2607479 RepID=A0A2W5Y487_9MICO|nr:Holliday junction branch migration protein RuvA [Xylanimonas oleitrophica]PZR52724.1 Holliday junction branch migration protein RuvA [Xylanimonas oleitrophica]
MIASLAGVVEHVSLDRAVIDVGGVGYLVHATPATLAGLRVGERAHLATTLVVREDSMTVYGFADAEEREVFETVQSVSGIGPRIALALLAVHTPDALRRAVHTQDVKALTRVPGIGAKGAQRIVLELSGKLAAPDDGAAAGGAAAPVRAGDRRDQVVEALVGLGYPAKVAEEAVAAVLSDAGAETVAEADVASTLRAALRSLGGRRG